jgi:hypothetical protein
VVDEVVDVAGERVGQRHHSYAKKKKKGTVVTGE